MLKRQEKKIVLNLGTRVKNNNIRPNRNLIVIDFQLNLLTMMKMKVLTMIQKLDHLLVSMFDPFIVTKVQIVSNSEDSIVVDRRG